MKKQKTLSHGVRQFGNKFVAFCSINRKYKYIGLYATQEEAAEERRRFIEHNSVNQRLGRPKKSKI